MRKGLAFTLDAVFAFLSLLVLASALILLNNSSVSRILVSEGLHDEAVDSVNLVSKLYLSDVQRLPYIQSMLANGSLTEDDLNRSVIYVIGEFWAEGSEENLTIARNIAKEVFTPVMPKNLEWAVTINNEAIYNTSDIPNSSTYLASSKRLVSGIAKSVPLTGCVSRAFIQKIGGKLDSAYAFMGGFVGEGNVTLVVRGVPAEADIDNIYIELNTGTNFSLEVNGFSCGQFNKSSSGNYSVDNWTITDSQCLNNVKKGVDNIVGFNFSGSDITKKYAGGGFAKITYNTTSLSQNVPDSMRVYLPGTDGVINYYGSFYVPGNVTNASARLSLLNNFTTFFVVGNKTLYNNNGSGLKTIVNLTNADFSAAFPDYGELSQKTVPIRLGIEANLTGQIGNADVVLITDVSGSMDAPMSGAGDGEVRDCSDPDLYDSDTQRLSVAKCIDKNFVDTILNGSGNKIGLVAFATNIVSYMNLTSDGTALKNQIGNYTHSSATCISCAINRAYEILNSSSGENRTRFVIVMSDGVPNVRSTPTCGNLTSISSLDSSLVQTVGDGGLSVNNWTSVYRPTSNNLQRVSANSSNYSFSVDSNGFIYFWNGVSWTQVYSAGVPLNGVSTYSPTLAFAVGSSGKIFKWNGISWSQSDDTGSNVFYSVHIYNSTLAFAVGSKSGSVGQIFKWNGISWSEDLDASGSPSPILYDVDVYNSKLAFAVGTVGSQARIYAWNGNSWSPNATISNLAFNGLDIYNSTLAFAVGTTGKIYQWNGVNWPPVSSPVTSTLKDVLIISPTLAYSIGVLNGRTIQWNGVSWIVNNFPYFAYAGNSSVGVSCSDSSTCSLTTSLPSLNSQYSSCRVRSELNATVHSVGFGPINACSFANSTLNSIAACGNGSYFASDNASQLADFYSSIAQAIVQTSNQSQSINYTGSISTSLHPDSFIELNYSPVTPPLSYQEISLSLESKQFPSCNSTLFIPGQLTVDSFKLTSYSADKWTSVLNLKNSLTGGSYASVFNLSVYNASTFIQTGDPFFLEFNSSRIKSGENNSFELLTSPNPGVYSSECSQNNKAIYNVRLNGAVNYSNVFFECKSRNATVYYDIDHDGVSDGVSQVSVGDVDLQSAGSDYVDVSQLNTTYNAVDDALQRLLDKLNFVITEGNSGTPGSSTNPIDVQLSGELGSNALTTQGVPYLWGPTEVSVLVWSK